MVLEKQDIETISELINNAISPLREDIGSLKQEVGSLKQEVGSLKITVAKLNDRVGSIEKFIKIDSEGVEEELNKAILEHLPHRFPGFTIAPFHLKYLHDPFSAKLITELDGGFIVSHTHQSRNALPERKYLVIVEAKHHVDYKRINYKLQQVYLLKKYIDSAKDITKGNNEVQYTKKFKDIVNAYQLDTIDEIYLYIGGPTWEPDMVKYVNMLNDANMKVLNNPRLQLDKITQDQFLEVIQYMKGRIGSIVPKGTRYMIHDVSATSIMAGGSVAKLKTYKSAKMVIMPNYINTRYT